MHCRALVKTKDLPKDDWSTPEWIPSENLTKNGKNIGKLAWNQTNYELIPSMKHGTPSTTIFGARCASRKQCTLKLEGGKPSRGKVEIVNCQFVKWVKQPIAY